MLLAAVAARIDLYIAIVKSRRKRRRAAETRKARAVSPKKRRDPD